MNETIITILSIIMFIIILPITTAGLTCDPGPPSLEHILETTKNIYLWPFKKGEK